MLKAIEKARPDGILIGGDTMVAKGTGDIRRALSLVRRLAARWPVYLRETGITKAVCGGSGKPTGGATRLIKTSFRPGAFITWKTIRLF